jgi:hypothetical protein
LGQLKKAKVLNKVLNMNRIFHLTLLPSLLAVSLTGVTVIPAQRAAANGLLRDIGTGAAAGAASGAIRGCGSLVNNAVKGAAAGAAVNAANNNRRDQRNRNLAQDAGVGAVASSLAGAITGGRCNEPLGNAVDGAAAGTAIHILNNRK